MKTLSPASWFLKLIAALLTLVSGAARAEPPTLWSCWMHQPEQLGCSLLRANAGAANPVADVTRQSSAMLLQVLRQQPGRLRGQTLIIPLHTVPFDDDGVRRLAQAVLCGGQQDGCVVRYQSDLAQLADDLRDAFADANDPLLALAS